MAHGEGPNACNVNMRFKWLIVQEIRHMKQFFISLGIVAVGANTVVGVIIAAFVSTEGPVGGGRGYVGYILKALEKGYLKNPGLHAGLTICLRFSSVLDVACVACCLFLSTGSYHVCIQIHESSASHVNHAQKPVLIRDNKIKRLDFGSTPDPLNLQPHPGLVWLKSGCCEAIAWCKVRLTKQRSVDLTTDGLRAMPLNTGSVPVRERRLQDWEKWKTYVPIHKQGHVCPNGVPARGENDNNDNNSDSE